MPKKRANQWSVSSSASEDDFNNHDEEDEKDRTYHRVTKPAKMRRKTAAVRAQPATQRAAITTKPKNSARSTSNGRHSKHTRAPSQQPGGSRSKTKATDVVELLDSENDDDEEDRENVKEASDKDEDDDDYDDECGVPNKTKTLALTNQPRQPKRLLSTGKAVNKSSKLTLLSSSLMDIDEEEEEEEHEKRGDSVLSINSSSSSSSSSSINRNKKPSTPKSPPKHRQNVPSSSSSSSLSRPPVNMAQPTPVDKDEEQQEETTTTTDVYDILYPTGLDRGEVTLLVQIDPPDAVTLDLEGATGAIGRLETDAQGQEGRLVARLIDRLFVCLSVLVLKGRFLSRCVCSG